MNKEEYLRELLELEKVIIYRLDLAKDRARGINISMKNTIKDYESLLNKIQKDIKTNDKRKNRNWWNLSTL